MIVSQYVMDSRRIVRACMRLVEGVGEFRFPLPRGLGFRDSDKVLIVQIG